MKRAIVAGEYRLFRSADGHFFVESVYGYEFWQRYLDVFDEVVVVARVGSGADVSSMLRVDGDRVVVHPLPYFVGPAAYARNYLRLRRAALKVGRIDGYVIFRVPGAVGSLIAGALPRRRSYSVEVVGDPAEVFNKGVVDHPLRPLFKARATRDLRRLCAGAAVVSYVSRYQLQQRYPAASASATYSYSSATMPSEAYVAQSRVYVEPLKRLIAVGSMDQMYKGFDVLVAAFSLLRVDRPSMTLTIVGGGKYLSTIQTQAGAVGASDAITFPGILSTPEQVREYLDCADLLVSSSRTEGLPRAVIEAQARGLAVVGTRVGGTPDLLADEQMCEPNDVEGLAHLIATVVDAPSIATRNASRGWARSRAYTQDALQQERNAMFKSLIDRAGPAEAGRWCRTFP